MTDHSITPPPELVHKWATMFEFLPDKQVFSEVAQWGADQELEACCKWMRDAPFGLSLNTSAYQIRAARRPKPLSLKEQALALVNSNKPYLDDTAMDIIRRALEQLNG